MFYVKNSFVENKNSLANKILLKWQIIYEWVQDENSMKNKQTLNHKNKALFF